VTSSSFSRPRCPCSLPELDEELQALAAKSDAAKRQLDDMKARPACFLARRALERSYSVEASQRSTAPV